MMDELDAQVDLAENLIRAGNLPRAEEICRDVLKERPDDLGAYDALFSIHLRRDELQAAYELCDWRLARCPECPDTYLNKLVAYGRLSALDMDYEPMRLAKGESFMTNIRPRLSNYPLRLAQAEILHAVYFKDTQAALKLVRYERDKGHLSPDWLNMIEASLGVYAGDSALSRDLLVQQLTENAQDFSALNGISVIDYYRGALFSAMKYARRAKRADPEQAALSQEVIVASLMGMIPVFWPAQIIITLSVFLSSKLEDYLAVVVRYGGVLATMLLYGFLSTKIMEMGYGNNNLMLLSVILMGAWTYYILFAFHDVGSYFSGRSKSIKLSDKY